MVQACDEGKAVNSVVRDTHRRDTEMIVGLNPKEAKNRVTLSCGVDVSYETSCFGLPP